MNFDEYIDRNEYPTMKWSKSYLAEHFGNAQAIPMSVADMDFKAPLSVIDSLKQRVSHGIFGYEYQPQRFFTALESWYQDRYDWMIDRQQIESCPSILSAIAILINQHSDAGQGVILQSPVFFEFRMVVRSNDRKVVKNALRFEAGRYQIDFDDLESKAADPDNRILILCNPHNPVGRVWTKSELEQVAAICTRHNVFVIADEIHGDFVFQPHTFTPYLTVSQEAVSCISPAKTFNISGMVDAMAIIPNKVHRERFHDFAHRYQINKTNVFALNATQTAYETGSDWLGQVLNYIQGNITLIEDFLDTNAINISLVKPEGTFLVWLDFRELGLDAKALEQFLDHKAQIALSQGYWFGREGAGFARMTIGCPRATVEQALNNLAHAVETGFSK